MESYLVLARKYRSATFDEVVGQEHVAETLKSAIKTERVAHAFLFVGTRGVGKTTMARILAKALNCLSAEAPTVAPCNRCNACIAIARGDDLDVIEIDGASNRGIDEIRALRSNAIFRPARCRYRIYYIDEVHMLTKEAFNALLKTLEEPPGHVKFIFSTTEPERVPATIVSRCQRFDFRDIPTRKIDEHLQAVCRAEQVQAESSALFRIARAAAGSMRDGLGLLDQLLAAGGGQVKEQDVLRVLGVPSEERTAAIIGAIAGNDPAAALNGLEAVLASGITLDSAVAALGEMFRHLMLISVCGPASELVELPESQRQPAAELAGRFTLPFLVQAVSLCQTTARGLRGLTRGRGLVEAAVVRLAAADKFVDAASLLERLERLAGATPPGGRVGGGAGSPARFAAGVRGQLDEKKKALPPESLARAPGPAQPPDANQARQMSSAAVERELEPPAPAQVPLETPRWELEYLCGHWSAVVAELLRQRQGHLSGLLSPARPLGLEGDLLKLGYDSPHEGLRQRAERAGGAIAAALGRVFGRQVRCQCVPTGEPGQAPSTAPVPLALSTAERAEINTDPAVRAVLELFDGSLADIRPAAAAAGEQDQNQGE